MKRSIAVLAAAGMAVLAASAAAQPHNEISVFGAWEDTREPVKTEVTSVFARYGRYVTPQFVATAGLSRSRFESNVTTSSTTYFTVGAKYYISASKVYALVPFVDASVGLAITDTGSDDSTDLTWELGGGASWFFTENTSFDAALRFYHTSTDAVSKGTRILVGLTMRF